MATIRTGSGDVYYQMKKFYGLNEIEDGTTRLKFGEAAESYNWKITSSQALQVREGTSTVAKFSGNVNGIWYGSVGDAEHMIVCVGTTIYKVNTNVTPMTKTVVGTTEDRQAHFFGYSNKLYVMNGVSYKVWDGNVSHTFTDVVGYVPTILKEASPTGGGTELQGINLLSTHRKVIYSPNNSATQFRLPESYTEASVTNHMYCVQIKYFGKEIWPTNEDTGHTYIITNNDSTPVPLTVNPPVQIDSGIICIQRDGAALASGTNTLQIEYTYPEDNSSVIKAMKHVETYNGNNGNRVFVYGDGTHKCYYSGLDYYGNPSAEYFPAMNEIAIGEANTPITAMIRHFARLVVFKTNSTYSINYSTITLETGSVTAGFVVQNVNKTIGNLPVGQAVLCMNNPISLHDGSVYIWKSNSSYNGNLTYDERQAKRISERVEQTLRSFELDKVTCFDNNYDQEFYILYHSGSIHSALIYNYEKDLWFKYTEFLPKYMVQKNNEIYCLCTDGTLRHLSRNYRNDDDGTGYHDTTRGITSIEDAKVTVTDEDFYEKFGEDTTEVVCTYTSDGWSALKTGEQESEIVTLEEIGVTLEDDEGEEITPEIDDTITIYGNVEINPQPIKAFWRSGSLAFDKDWMRKYCGTIFVSVLPEFNSDVVVTARSDVRSSYTKKKIGYSLITFMHMNFQHFSFNSNSQPKMAKVKLKVKKFTYYQLCFEFNMNDDIEEPRTDITSTILGVDFQIRYTGNVK